MREEIKNLMTETRKFIEESEDFIFENYKSSYTLFNAEMEDIKENLALIENSIDSIPEDALERVKENLNTIKQNAEIVKNNYDSNNLSTTSTNQESIDVNAYLDSIETINDEGTQTEVLPTEFVQPYVEEAKIDNTPVEETQTAEPVQTEVSADIPTVLEPQLITDVNDAEPVPTIDTLPQVESVNTQVQPQDIVMPTGSIDMNTLDNIAANITAAPVEPQPVEQQIVEPQIDASQIAFQSQPEEGINVQELDDLFNS